MLIKKSILCRFKFCEARFQILIAMTMNIVFFNDVAHCTWLQSYTATIVAELTVLLILTKDLSLLTFRHRAFSI